MSVETAPASSCPLTIDGVFVYGWDHPPYSGLFAALPELPTEAENIGRHLASQPTVVSIDGYEPIIDWTSYTWSKSQAPEEFALLSPLTKDHLFVAGDFVTIEGINSANESSHLSEGLLISGIAGLITIGAINLASRRSRQHRQSTKYSRQEFLKLGVLGLGATIVAVVAGDHIQNAYKRRLAVLINSCQNDHPELQLRDWTVNTLSITHDRTLVGIGKMNSLPSTEISERGLNPSARRAEVWGFDHLHPSEQQSLSGVTANYATVAGNIYLSEAAYLVASETPRETAINQLSTLRVNLSTSAFYRVVDYGDKVGFEFAINSAGKVVYRHPDILANVSPEPVKVLHRFEQILA